MLRHIVLVKSNELDRVDEVLATIPALVEVVPGLNSVEIGKDSSPRTGGYERVFVLNFSQRSDLDTWATHPAHQPIRSTLLEISYMIVFDYEV